MYAVKREKVVRSLRCVERVRERDVRVERVVEARVAVGRVRREGRDRVERVVDRPCEGLVYALY